MSVLSTADKGVLVGLAAGAVYSLAKFGLSGVHKFLCPEPISPLFKAGGALSMLNEDFAWTFGVISLLFIVDKTIRKKYIKKEARYFFLHSIANAIIAAASFPDVMRAIFHPVGCMTGPYCSILANSGAAAIHLYHCMAFDLGAADIFHHLYFVVSLCGMAIPYKQNGGVANNMGCFFLSGLPGGLDYVLLTLYKHGKISKMTEKSLNAYINVWMRGPFMSVYAWLCWQAFNSGDYGCPTFVLVLAGFLHFFNGQHYCRQAVETYATHLERGKVERLAKKQEAAAAKEESTTTRSKSPKKK